MYNNQINYLIFAIVASVAIFSAITLFYSNRSKEEFCSCDTLENFDNKSGPEIVRGPGGPGGPGGPEGPGGPGGPGGPEGPGGPRPCSCGTYIPNVENTENFCPGVCSNRRYPARYLFQQRCGYNTPTNVNYNEPYYIPPTYN